MSENTYINEMNESTLSFTSAPSFTSKYIVYTQTVLVRLPSIQLHRLHKKRILHLARDAALDLGRIGYEKERMEKSHTWP
jgi:hypothetical protein